VLFVTPEYNRSIPGGLKNAIDWASRPYGQNAFTRKPSAVIGTSAGAIGTAVAQQNLRSVMVFCNSPQMNAPEAYIQFTPNLISDDGTVSVESTEKFLRKMWPRSLRKESEDGKIGGGRLSMSRTTQGLFRTKEPPRQLSRGSAPSASARQAPMENSQLPLDLLNWFRPDTDRRRHREIRRPRRLDGARQEAG
jgi:hypothetical protein